MKCATSRYTAHPVLTHAHVRTEVIILLSVPVPFRPVHSLTIKLHELIVESTPEKLTGRYIVNIALFHENHVHGANRIFHCCIQIELGNSHDKKFCVPVSVKSSPVPKVILHISCHHDIAAKYSHEKLFTFQPVTLLKLLCIHHHDNVCPTLV